MPDPRDVGQLLVEQCSFEVKVMLLTWFLQSSEVVAGANVFTYHNLPVLERPAGMLTL